MRGPSSAMTKKRVDVVMVIDFMCPWSFIGLRSLQAARSRYVEQLEFAPVKFVPFEFDPPGTYPADGLDWTEYCKGYGEAKARFLLEEKLPRAFALGKEVGINFRMDRRIVDTIDVNTALDLAERFGVAETFAEQTLAGHFERLENPNNNETLGNRLEALGVPRAEVVNALGDELKYKKNAERTEKARLQLRGGVPDFAVFCEGKAEDLSRRASGGPTSPAYFQGLFEACLAS
eukprot:TRINITY_DN92069_c0_g1_i1.p1 TRINITY_DN92069_c0_g1~~TRINITY_DN92069_c0_g1_i1.p1  ORF type:complete len:266 (+),score=60.82 TRINITY_DN92069_c0_g1_i1:100-798(+)